VKLLAGYPFDDFHFISVSSDAVASKAQTGKGIAESRNKKRADLLTHLVLTQHMAQSNDKNAIKTTVTRNYSAVFCEEATVQMLKVYFSQTAGLFSLAVTIEDQSDRSLVFHKVYPPHTVAQFSDHAIYNPNGELSDYGLTISSLAHKCKNLSISLAFSGSVTEKAPAPTCYIEFYGKLEEHLEAKARA